jgi:hypothetical protein
MPTVAAIANRGREAESGNLKFVASSPAHTHPRARAREGGKLWTRIRIQKNSNPNLTAFVSDRTLGG